MPQLVAAFFEFLGESASHEAFDSIAVIHSCEIIERGIRDSLPLIEFSARQCHNSQMLAMRIYRNFRRNGSNNAFRLCDKPELHVAVHAELPQVCVLVFSVRVIKGALYVRNRVMPKHLDERTRDTPYPVNR